MCNERMLAVNGAAGGASYDAKAVTVVFLALALREARNWFLKDQKTLYGQMDLRWSLNIGLPSADFADKSLCATYDTVASAAWALSIRSGEFCLEAAGDLVAAPEQWNRL